MSSMFFCCCIFLVPLLFQQPKGLTTGLLFGARICITVTFTVVYVYAPEVSHRSWFLFSKGKWIFILSFSFLIINMSARWKFYTQLNFKISILSQLDYPWVFFFPWPFVLDPPVYGGLSEVRLLFSQKPFIWRVNGCKCTAEGGAILCLQIFMNSQNWGLTNLIWSLYMLLNWYLAQIIRNT